MELWDWLHRSRSEDRRESIEDDIDKPSKATKGDLNGEHQK
jgi:hypothetical protein